MTTECPKSYVHSESIYFLEQFSIWTRQGGDLLAMPARTAEAIMILDAEWRKGQS